MAEVIRMPILLSAAALALAWSQRKHSFAKNRPAAYSVRWKERRNRWGLRPTCLRNIWQK